MLSESIEVASSSPGLYAISMDIWCLLNFGGDVFLNLRAEDMRKHLIDHLFAAPDMDFHFKDDVLLERWQEV